MDFMINKLSNLLTEALENRLYDKGFSAVTDYDSKVSTEQYTDIIINIENDIEEVVLSLVYRIGNDLRPICIIMKNKEIDINDLDTIVNTVLLTA